MSFNGGITILILHRREDIGKVSQSDEKRHVQDSIFLLRRELWSFFIQNDFVASDLNLPWNFLNAPKGD